MLDNVQQATIMLRGWYNVLSAVTAEGNGLFNPGRHGQRGTLYRLLRRTDYGQKTPPDHPSRPRHLPPFQAGAGLCAGAPEPIEGLLFAETGARIQPGRTGLERGQEQPHRKEDGEKQGGSEGPPHFRIGFVETKHPAYYFFFPSAGHQVCGGCRLISFGLYILNICREKALKGVHE